MPIYTLSTREDLHLYDVWIKTHPQGNLWQSLERKKYLESLGKEVRVYALKNDGQPADRSLESVGGILASALVSIDTTVGGFSTWEIARGPLLGLGDRGLGVGVAELIGRIIEDAKKEKCIALYISPTQNLLPNPTPYPLHISPRHIHCEATRLIDLTQSEEDILSQMKPKGRYNIKVATKKGVHIKESKDIDAFYTLVTKTGARDKFTHLSKKQYEAFLQKLHGSFLLLAYSDDKKSTPIAGVLSVIWNGKGIYYYGASDHAYRASMAPYLLQWESMKLCKRNGCTSYDLLGVAPQRNGKLSTSHPWAGISSFKEKFGGEVKSYPHERIIILNPVVYWMIQLKRKILR